MIDDIVSHFHLPKLQYPVVVSLHPVCMFLLARTPSPEHTHMVSLLLEPSTCQSVLHVSTWVFLLLLVLVKTFLTLKAFFLSPFVWCCGALQLNVLPHYFPIFLHLARWFICFVFLFNSWSVCVVSNGIPLPLHLHSS